MINLIKRENKGKLLLAFVAMVIASFDGVVLSYIVSEAGKFSMSSSNQEILLFGVKGIIGLFAVYFSQYIYTTCVSSIIKDFNLVLKQNFFWNSFYNSKKLPDSSKIISNLSNDFKLIENQYFQEFFELIGNVALCTVSLIYMLKYNFYIALLFLSMSILPMIIPLVFSNKLKKAGSNWSFANEEYINSTKDYIQGFQVLKTYRVYKEIYLRSLSKLRKLEEKNYKLIKTQAFAEFISSLCAGISFVVPFVVGCFVIINTNSLSFSSLMGIFLLNDRVVGPLNTITSGINRMKTTEKLRKKLFIFDDQKNKCEEAPGLLNDSSEKLKTLQFDNVVYHIQNGIDLKVNEIFEAPFKILVIGDSGSGKTTLLNLIKGNLSPKSGKIIAKNGLNEDIDISKNVAYISQNPYIFNTTLMENITLFENEKFSKNEVVTVLKKVALYDELGKENSLDYQCGPMGERLSGGQMQKIEVARALLRNKKLLLIDEATANLDNKNAKRIRDLLFRLSIPFIEVAHHYNINDKRYTDKFELIEGKLYKI